MDKDDTADIISLIGVSAALQLSGLPFQGPLSAAKVGFVEGNYVLNPSLSELENSKLDMVIAGSTDAVFMVESEAKENRGSNAGSNFICSTRNETKFGFNEELCHKKLNL